MAEDNFDDTKAPENLVEGQFFIKKIREYIAEFGYVVSDDRIGKYNHFVDGENTASVWLGFLDENAKDVIAKEADVVYGDILWLPKSYIPDNLEFPIYVIQEEDENGFATKRQETPWGKLTGCVLDDSGNLYDINVVYVIDANGRLFKEFNIRNHGQAEAEIELSQDDGFTRHMNVVLTDLDHIDRKFEDRTRMLSAAQRNDYEKVGGMLQRIKYGELKPVEKTLD